MADAQKEVPKGQRFTHVYLERGKPRGDSTRMRKRLAAAIWPFSASASHDLDFYSVITGKLGIEPPTGMGGVMWDEFFAKCELRDILDFVTLAYRHGREVGRHRPTASLAAGKWLKVVEVIFREGKCSLYRR